MNFCITLKGLPSLLFTLYLSLSSQNIFASETDGSLQGLFRYSKIISQHQTEVLGQEIGSYEQRWFWEPSGNAETYTSFFYFENMNPKVILVNQSDASNKNTELRADSLYHEFLKDNKVILKQPPLKNWNYVSTGNDGHHLFENMYGNYAWDIIKKKKNLSFNNQGLKNKDHFVWAEPVYSPISGTVVEITRDVSDNFPDPTNSGDLSSKGDGNLILIHVYERFYFILMHFKKNSIPLHLKPGTQLRAGDYLGDVGNSGVSYSPHLHMTMYYWNSQFKRMISVPTLFEETLTKSALDKESVYKDFSVPQTGEQIKAFQSNH